MASPLEGDDMGGAANVPELRLTRRAAIAAALASGGGMVSSDPSAARVLSAGQQLTAFRHEVQRARISRHLKGSLLTLITHIQRDLKHRANTRARSDLLHLVALLHQNAGRHGLRRRTASHWIHTVERIRGMIHVPHHHHGGPHTSLRVAHSGVGAWVVIDTRGLTVRAGTRLLIDGRDATGAFGYPQPSKGRPWIIALMSVATHTISWGPYTAVIDVYWRGFPFVARHDSYSALNQQYFDGTWPNVARAPGGIDQNAPFQAWGALNNGYSVVPDPAPATSCVFAVAPGDQGYVPGSSATKDTRAELGLTDMYASGSGAVPGSPPGGIDAMGDISRMVRFWRLDYEFPSSWTAPVPVQNTEGSWAQPPYGSGRGAWRLPPANRGGPRPRQVITNTYAALSTVSNVTETGGPAVIVWGLTNSGRDVCWRYQPVAMGRGLKPLLIDAHPFSFDGRESTILEYCPQLYCTDGSGAKIYAYGVPPGHPPYGGGYLRTWRFIGGQWQCTSAGNQYAVPGTPRISDGAIIGDPVHGPDAGKIFGPTLKSNSQGNLVEGLEATPGINAGANLPTPVCVREWPLLIGPTFASVSAPSGL